MAADAPSDLHNLGFVDVGDHNYEVHTHDCFSRACLWATFVKVTKTHCLQDRLEFYDKYPLWEMFAKVCIHPLNVILVTTTMVLPRLTLEGGRISGPTSGKKIGTAQSFLTLSFCI